MALAYRMREDVLVASLRSDTALTWARPDGTFKTTMHTAPVRMRTGTGQWIAIDLTMERKPDGSVGPKAHPHGLTLSGQRSASSTEFVSVGAGEQRTSLGWDGALPQPVLDGPKATYPEVKPGVDLVVEAHSTGYEYFLVVKNRGAAASVASVVMPWRQGSSVTQSSMNGAMQLQSPSGGTVDVLPAKMWDARTSVHGSDGAPRATVPMATVHSADGTTDLVLTPDQKFLADPATQYPVTIDPSVTLRPAYDAFVQNTYSTDESAETELRIGWTNDASKGCGSPCVARSFLSFHYLDGYAGASVVSASLHLYNWHSYNCGSQGWEAWKTSYVNYTARWNNQPTWVQKDGTSSVSKGNTCAADWVEISVAKTFGGAFSAGDSTANVGLKATNETSNGGWKKFSSSEAGAKPYVQVVWNRTPNVPTGWSIDSCYSACTSPAVVRSATPTLKATVSDPDGGTLRAEYEVWDNAKTAVKAKSGTAVTGVASGTAKPWRVTPALPDGTYHWAVRACDSYVCGGYLAWFTFTVNTSPVGLPTVSGTPYAEKTTGTWNGGPGQPGSFTFGANGTTDVYEYIYSVNDGGAVTVAAGTPQAQLLTSSQQQVADLSGFTAGNTTLTRATDLGHNSTDSLKLTPVASGTSADTYATVGGDYGGMRLGMQAGKRYNVTGWINVPASTGLSPAEARGLRIVAYYKLNGAFTYVSSSPATVVGQWQALSVVITIPTAATDAFVRLYNGFSAGSGKAVYWDDLSAREVIGTTTTTSITPTKDGVNRLAVQSRNTAGVTSDPRIYDFLVTPSTGSWNWTLDEGTGTQAGSVPNTRPAKFSATGVTWADAPKVGPGAVTLDGSGELKTLTGSGDPLPVLDTTDSAGFTVTAWVRLTDTTASRTAVSQDGTRTSMFRLGFRNDLDVDGDTVADKAWCFTIAASDTPAASSAQACTKEYVVTGDWVSLVGVYNKPANTIGLYVNGTESIGGVYASEAAAGGWSATGAFAIGRSGTNTLPAERWIGDLDHVYASQYVWTEQEVDEYAFG